MSDPPRSCEELVAGSLPDALVDFTWQHQMGTCSSSACWTIMTLSQADCAAARAWATNAHFVDVLRNGIGCSEGMVPESFELTLAQDAPRRKTWGCGEPTVVLERACWSALADRTDSR